jgi:transposase
LKGIPVAVLTEKTARKIAVNSTPTFTCDVNKRTIPVKRKGPRDCGHSPRGEKHSGAVTPECSPDILADPPQPTKVAVVDLRELKGLEIAARSRIAFKDGVWLVPSQSGKGNYQGRLDPGGTSCTCEDFQLRREPCKHVHAARYAQERDNGGKAPAVDTSSVPKRPTYKQDWPAYNLAQTTEKHRFLQLLFDLCAGIQEPPPPKTGRRPHSFRDQVFAMAFKVYSTFSERRFSCDLKDAHGRGYLSVPIPGGKLHSFFEKDALTPVLHSLIVQSALPLRAVEAVFAPDSTGFSVSRFVRWYDEKYGEHRSGKDWVKAHAICGVKTNVVTGVIIEDRDAHDCPMFKPLVEATARHFNVKEVPADKAYLSCENLELVERLGGTAYIPFKSNNTGAAGGLFELMFHYYNFHREEFLKHYHQRSNAESTFSMLKAKFRDHVRAKTKTAMVNEVLCKVLCHNICCLIQSQCELGIEPVFWQDGPKVDHPDILRLPAGG